MGRRWLYTSCRRQVALRFRAAFAVMVTLPILAHAGQSGFGPIPVVVGTVVEQQIATEIEVVGSVEPQLVTTLSTEIAGLTQSFDLREGAFVQQGNTIVAQLKATELELALNEAEAELAKARADLTKLKRGLRPEEIDEKRAEVAEKKAWVEKYAKDVERTKSLLTRDMVSLSEFNQTEANYLAAKAQHERTWRSLRVAELGFRQEDIAAGEAEAQRLQAKVQRLGNDVQKTVIRSPISGFITTAMPRSASGSSVAAGWLRSSTWPRCWCGYRCMSATSVSCRWATTPWSPWMPCRTRRSPVASST